MVGLAALALYAGTLPPGLTWAYNGADGGDLLAAALTGGVPHPTGYPTYQLLLRLAISAFGDEPARSGAWLSAICAAAAVALLTDLARRVVAAGANRSPQRAAVAACIAGLAWAVSPLLWGQAVIVEVYALNTLFAVGLLWQLWRWAEVEQSGRDGTRRLAVAGLTLSLGMGNHLTLALILPGALYWIWVVRRGKAHAWRALIAPAIAAAAGLLVYGYLPLAASGGPPINWGDPVTPGRFLWVVTGRLYAPLAFGLPLSELPERLAGWATLLVTQFMPWGFALALVGLWQLDHRQHHWWRATMLIWLAFTVYAIGYNSTDSDAYLLPAFAVMALWLAEGIAALLQRIKRPAWLAAVIAAALLFATVVAPAFLRAWEAEDLSPHLEAEGFWRAALAEAEPDAIILTSGDARTFALWYAIYGLKERSDIAVVNVNLYGYEWYRRALADTHPHLLPSVNALGIDELIRRWALERPVYAAEDLDLRPEGLTGTRMGVLTKLNP